jgi:DNA repair protein RadC
MSAELFNEFERELLDAARVLLSDGLTRLSTREGLFPTTRNRTRADRAECTKARGALVDYLVATYGPLRHEVACVALIDAQGRLISVKEFPRGKATECEVSPLVLAEYIIQSGACAVVLVHNHPSGDNTPSEQDVKMTDAYKSWLGFMRVELIDHLVISMDGAASIIGGL